MVRWIGALSGRFRQTVARGWVVLTPSSRLRVVNNTSRAMSDRAVASAANRLINLHVEKMEKEASGHWWNRHVSSWVGPTTILALLGLLVDWRVRAAESRRNELVQVNDQLSKLYGPLYGNRLAVQKTYKKVLSSFGKKHLEKDYSNLREYLQDAKREWEKSNRERENRETQQKQGNGNTLEKDGGETQTSKIKVEDKGRRMLTRWRRFLLYIIHPLDLQAEEIIRANAHLIENSEENAELFRKFVFHVNYETFIVTNWKDGGFVVGFQQSYRDKDFDLSNNTAMSEEDEKEAREMLLDLEKHVTETYGKLIERQKQLIDGLK